MKKTKQPYPVGKLVALMGKLHVNETQALIIGQHIVSEAQTLFLKWKTNFTAHREAMNLMYKPETKTSKRGSR